MALPDPQYVLQQDLESIFYDKNTGLPLAGGKVFYYKDNNRNSPKTVYELSGAPPNYTYTALPNPITLSNIGTPMNTVGDNVAVYYRPWNDFDPASPETYYIVVEDALGNPQFTRENWPYPNLGTSSSGVGTAGAYDNELSNPQFVEVNFDTVSGLTLVTAGSDIDIEIAPAWNLLITSTGAGSVTVNRVSVAGNSGDQSNPPYILSVSSTGLVQSIKLYQRLANNPAIWSQTILGANGNGYIATSIMLAPGASVTMRYEPNVGTQTQLIAATNIFGNYQNFENTVQLPPGNNTTNADIGYVDIAIYLPPGQSTSLSSVQIVGLETNIAQVPYEQQTVNRQKALLAHYWQPKLEAKPIPSYLIGWDFPMNPAQALGSNVAPVATGNNGSYYAWDQTIIFQSVDNAITVSRTASGALELTATLASQMAIIQYIEQAQARELLSGRCSVRLKGVCSDIAERGTVSLWAKTGALPDIKAPNFDSIVATLGANGSVATRNGTWVELDRGHLGAAEFSLTLIENEFSFSGWTDSASTPLATTADWFAIVIGFNEVAIGESISIEWVGLNAGDIPTRPAPKSHAETLLDCQRHYWKTFEGSTVPAQGVGVDTGYLQWQATRTAALSANICNVLFPTEMRAVPDITLFNPINANADIYDFTTNTDAGTNAIGNITTKTFSPNGTPAGGGAAVGDILGVHAVADARPGVV